MNNNSTVSFAENILWIIFGGFFSALGYVFGGLALCATIIGIPFGIQCFKLAALVLMPFGSRVETDPSSSGCLSIILNILWLVTGGWFTALVHLFFGILLCITIIGIPFGLQHFKLMALSVAPFGKRIVPLNS